MPIPGGARYRVTTSKTGKKVRLAFQNGEVVEAKNLETGDTHTPEEFAEDRRRRRGDREVEAPGGERPEDSGYSPAGDGHADCRSGHCQTCAERLVTG